MRKVSQRSFSVSILIVCPLLQSSVVIFSQVLCWPQLGLRWCSHCRGRSDRSRAYICSSHSGSTPPPWTRSSISYLDQHTVRYPGGKWSDLTEAFVEAESFLLTVKLSLLTLAVMTLTVTALHHTASPRPVVTPAPHDDRLVVLQAQGLGHVLRGVDDQSLGWWEGDI